ncbi:sugar phosphate isomerase/epimerase family protein [Paenibacillus ginsengarvi]|uniref:Sugar phosphate isomerase/epimerase n=1 Tax=Paenibacillus ginsengarvi TaxID=400777 RepID=A0A3B0BS97_9BACL|nr:TIM barrel protein [Paenibacillus ginsengarvi]RKN75782.1 sugar phosphate isomerase/epimerase [Paenibacillus ginsengarvi]
MVGSGLLSVTFRKLSPVDVIRLTGEAGLQAIEWGGDIHVPHGDVKAAAEVGRLTAESGIRVASYGSYYRAGIPDSAKVGFASVLETAIALGAPSIRVWAGDKGSADTDEAWREQVAADTRAIAEIAMKEGVTIDFEYHARTLTDTADSAVLLMELIDHPNVRCNWQPPVNETFEQRLDGLKRISPWLANVHVFHWGVGVKYPLADGSDDWLRYIQAVRETEKRAYLMLEFVKDESPEQFLRDAETLKRLIAD